SRTSVSCLFVSSGVSGGLAEKQQLGEEGGGALSGVALALCLSALIVATAVGNALVCLSVCLVRRLRHPSNHLLVSLAASDLCVALLVMPPALHLELTGHRWDLGRAACDAWVSMDVASCTASILNLCMISVDRYLAITRPLTYGVRRTARRAWACIGAVWLLAALISVPPLLVLGNEHGSAERPTCLVCQHLAYQLYATLGAFYIPLLVMLAMYWQIHQAAKRVVEAEHRARPGPRTRSLRLALRERKASITLGIILTAFTACWLPFFALALIAPLGGNPLSETVHSFALWLGYANSALNPIIYVTFHHDFRKAFRDLLCLRCSRGTAVLGSTSPWTLSSPNGLPAPGTP
ncbi:dopamine D1/beta receptor, putative, partial [Ixodes scapularis]